LYRIKPVLFGYSLHGASADAGSAIYAGCFVAFGFAVFHAESADGANTHAGFAADTGFFIDLDCHDLTP